MTGATVVISFQISLERNFSGWRLSTHLVDIANRTLFDLRLWSILKFNYFRTNWAGDKRSKVGDNEEYLSQRILRRCSGIGSKGEVKLLQLGRGQLVHACLFKTESMNLDQILRKSNRIIWLTSRPTSLPKQTYGAEFGFLERLLVFHYVDDFSLFIPLLQIFRSKSFVWSAPRHIPIRGEGVDNKSWLITYCKWSGAKTIPTISMKLEIATGFLFPSKWLILVGIDLSSSERIR